MSLRHDTGSESNRIPPSDAPDSLTGSSPPASGNGSVECSLVIPAYNEAGRLPQYLTEIRHYFDVQFAGDYEVIVVDDGSADDLAERLARDAWPQLRVIRHPVNLGKGAAVRTGVLASRGRRLLFADADGATPIAEELRLRGAIERGAAIAVGSRLLPGEGVVRRRTWRRAVIGRAFAIVARSTLGVPVRDTQCGFKMFLGDVGRSLFAETTEQGFLFDLELLILARRRGLVVAEVPVNWADVEGSRMQIGRQSGRIICGLWRLRGRQATLQSSEVP